MGKKITKNHVRDSSLALEFNVSKIRALTDKETEERAKNDPDAPIVDAKFAKKSRKLNQK